MLPFPYLSDLQATSSAVTSPIIEMFFPLVAFTAGCIIGGMVGAYFIEVIPDKLSDFFERGRSRLRWGNSDKNWKDWEDSMK